MSFGFGRVNELADQCHQIAFDHGFWGGFDALDTRHILALLALVGTEVSEGVEAIRKPKPTEGPFGNLEEELADTIIRCFDIAAGLDFNIEQAIVDKMEVNRNRPYKHGKKA